MASRGKRPGRPPDTPQCTGGLAQQGTVPPRTSTAQTSGDPGADKAPPMPGPDWATGATDGHALLGWMQTGGVEKVHCPFSMVLPESRVTPLRSFPCSGKSRELVRADGREARTSHSGIPGASVTEAPRPASVCASPSRRRPPATWRRAGVPAGGPCDAPETEPRPLGASRGRESDSPPFLLTTTWVPRSDARWEPEPAPRRPSAAGPAGVRAQEGREAFPACSWPPLL